MKTLGEKIMEILEIRELSQSWLAKEASMSRGVLNEICNNKRTSVTVDTLKKIARALNIHPAYFLEDATVGPGDILPHLSKTEREFILNSKSLPWIKLSQEADSKGLTPDKIRQIIDIVSK